MPELHIAIVTPRYGATVGGGAEALARKYAKHLSARMRVTVLTTCALDYQTWRDHFSAGTETEDGVTIRRFPVPQPRDPAKFNGLTTKLLSTPTAELESAWMDAQGPNAPGLLAHLEDDGDSYDAVLFIPYLYATTVRGLPLVADRAILIAALHDEPPLRLEIFRSILESPAAWVFLTSEEQALAESRFAIDPSRTFLVGAGVDPVPDIGPESFATTYGASQPYVLCLGRVEPSKGSDALLAHHAGYRAQVPDGLDLVMVGPKVMDLPDEPWLVAPGFVSEEEKHSALAGATVLVSPSPYESLSLVLLEAWSHAVPTVAASTSPVLVGQSRRAGAGLWYSSAAEYAACVNLLHRTPALARGLGRSGWRFTQQLGWPRVTDRLEAAIAQTVARRRDG